ncbi:MAG: chromosomal replication initiator protein DnaA [Eubacterium sp.]|nr:chromosomal replication initiator protein DnaA [Eubacterium sp.]MDY5496696.1 chromosomal replication initiator protein DnaA [Anaerobutyricum sp.]
MKELIQSKWEEILQILIKEHEISEVAVNTWIRPLTIQSVTDDTITFFMVRGPRGIEFIKHKYYDIYLSMAIEQITGKQFKILFTDSSSSVTVPEKKSVIVPPEYIGNLNPRYTFDTFVVGPTNKMAHAVSVAVAESPGGAYNPLFLYGGAGLGKTHLMHSIAHHIIKNRPDLKVLYVTSEKFTNELIDSLKHDKNKEFRDKYRNIDVLLIDDIQFIIGKESTQEEFFHTFNELHEAKKQIVISSDKHPREISTLEERLRSRFEWGITADIQPPDYETKMAILKKRAELEHLDISTEVMEYVAANINSNIRELEGALNKICVFANLEKKPVTLELAENALKDTIECKKEITPQLIMEVVAEHYNITVSDILSKKKNKEIANPRQICMYLARKYTDYSLQSIGKAMGNRDHSTILHGHDKINKMAQTDESLKTNLNILVKKLNPQN